MLFGKLIRTSVAALGALAVSSVTQANAADIYSGGGYKDVPVQPPCCSFAGFYVGGAMGMAWIDVDRPSGLFTDYNSWKKVTNTGIFNDQKLKSVNGFGGGQLGYNFQSSCCWLFGIEVDLGALGVNNNFHRNLMMNDRMINSVSLDGNNNDDAFFAGDVTGRIGYTFGNSMVYAKGGFAFVDLNNNINETIYWKTSPWHATPTGNPFDTYNGNNSDNWLTGWTVGAGWEWKPCCQSNWSIKVEYLHYDFGSNNNNNCCNDWFNQTYPSTINNRFRTGDVTADTVKVGFNYFWSPGYSAQPPLK